MTDPIQQQLILARKNQILDAAAAVFSEKGFHQSTTKDIARQAEISEGTIYNYFESKAALLLGVFERMKATIIQENMPLAPADLDFRTFIRTLLAHPLQALQQDNFALFRIVTSELMTNPELRARYQQQILEPTFALAEDHLTRQMIERGQDPSSVSLALRAISGMVMGLIFQRIIGDPAIETNWEQLPDLLTDLLLNGLENLPK